jgi:GNAT superfamily N-acetyltransferase
VAWTIRLANQDDVPKIEAWTRDTFTWGDYVAEGLPAWIDDKASAVVVCVDDDDNPLAVSRAEMLSPTEAWLSAARVHPEHRRTGLGAALNDHGVQWAGDHGAQIVRLVVEEDNEVAQSQVEKLGYRNTCVWILGHTDTPRGPLPRERDRLHPAPSADADAGWLLWLSSELARAGRELYPGHWRWRKALRSDLDTPIVNRNLFQGGAGWVVAVPAEDTLEVGWMVTDPADCPTLLEGIAEVSRQLEMAQIEIFIPETPWTREALIREGFTTRRLLVYAKSL